VISNGRDGVGSNLVANLGGTDFHVLDHWNMSNSTNSGPNIWKSSWQGWQDSAIQEDLWVSLSLLPLGNHGLLSSSWSSNQGESSIGESSIGESSISDMSGQGETSMVGQRLGGVCDGREGWRVVDERSGGRDHTAASSKNGGLSIGRSLAITVTIRVTIVTSVSPVSVSPVSVISIVSISLGLGISRSLAVVTKVSESIANSDRVSGYLMLNLGGSDHIRLDNWNMSNSPNSGPNIWQWSSSSVGQTSTIQELWVSLSGGEGEQSGSQEKFDHDAGC